MELETATIEGLCRYNTSELNWARVRNYNQTPAYNTLGRHLLLFRTSTVQFRNYRLPIWNMIWVRNRQNSNFLSNEIWLAERYTHRTSVQSLLQLYLTIQVGQKFDPPTPYTHTFCNMCYCHCAGPIINLVR